MWTEKQSVDKWPWMLGVLSCCHLGGRDWYRTRCSRLISRRPCLLLDPQDAQSLRQSSVGKDAPSGLLALGYMDPAGTRETTDISDIPSWGAGIFEADIEKDKFYVEINTNVFWS